MGNIKIRYMTLESVGEDTRDVGVRRPQTEIEGHHYFFEREILDNDLPYFPCRYKNIKI
jgi:hypothetical protein